MKAPQRARRSTACPTTTTKTQQRRKPPKANERGRFETLVLRYYSGVYNFACRLTDDPVEAVGLTHGAEQKWPKNWKLTIKKWKSFGYMPSQKHHGSNGQRMMSVFEIEKRVAAINKEINDTFKRNGKRVEGDGIDDLKKRRDELQKQLTA